MSTTRILAAAIVGGIVMFVCGATVHNTAVGRMGMKNLPAESPLAPQIKSTLSEPGLYTFPPMDEKCMDEAGQKAYMDKLRTGPVGMLFVDPAGYELNFPRLLITEFLSNVAAALIAAIILSRIPGTRMQRAFMAMGMGLIGWLSIDVSYWNWDRFPIGFAATSLIEQGGGWLASGLAIALVLGRGAAKNPA